MVAGINIMVAAMITPTHITRDVVNIFFILFSVFWLKRLRKGARRRNRREQWLFYGMAIILLPHDCKAILAGILLYAAFFPVVDGVAVGGVFGVVIDNLVVRQLSFLGKQLNILIDFTQLGDSLQKRGIILCHILILCDSVIKGVEKGQV